MYRCVGRPAFACAGLAAAFAVAAPSALASAPKSTVRLANSRSHAAARAARLGAVASATKISFEVGLRLPDQAGATAFAKAVSTPGSSRYRHFLTPAQWEKRFSPSASDVAEVAKFLNRSGFTVGRPSADRMEVPASGTAQQVERAFATSLSIYKVQGHNLRVADRNLAMPASIAGIVSGVTGVSQTLAQPEHMTGAALPAKAAPATPDTSIPQPAGFRVAPPCGTYSGQQVDTTLPSYGNHYPSDPPWAVCGYTPPQFRSAYGLTGPDTGKGVTVAIVDAYASPTLFSDAQKFALRNDPSNPL